MNKWAAIMRESALARFLIPAGILSIAAGIVFLIFAKDTSSYTKTEATVTRLELVEEETDKEPAQYEVYIKYTATDGKEYDGSFGVFPDFREGDRIKIVYNPEDPQEFHSPGNQFVTAFAIIAAGAAALIGGIVSLVNAVRRQKALKEQEKEWSYGK